MIGGWVGDRLGGLGILEGRVWGVSVLFFLSDDLPRCSIWLWALLTQRPDS